ncbi:MAG: CDP-glycerol glycerophosphotransferase family protein [Methanoregula sp.]
MGKKILYLATPQIPNDSRIILDPTTVYFFISCDNIDIPKRFCATDKIWSVMRSDNDCSKTNNFFNDIQHIKISGKNIFEFTLYDGINMWQFMPSHIWPVFFKTIEYIDLIKFIVEKHHPSELRYFSAEHYLAQLWEGVIKSIGEKYEIPVNRIFESMPIEISKFFPRRFSELYYLSIKIKNSCVVGGITELCTQLNKKISTKFTSERKDQSEKKILCATLGQRHWVSIPGTDNVKYDEQFYPFLSAFRTKGYSKFIFVDCLDSPKKLLKKRNDEKKGIVWNRYSDYLQNGNASHHLAKKHFNILWKKIKIDTDFQKKFCYEGIPLFPAVCKELQTAFLILMPDCVKLLSISKNMIELERPDAIIVTYETGPWERALIIQGGLNGIPTIGLQHGMLYDDNCDHSHLSIGIDPLNNPNAFIVPKITCVWGPLWKSNLTNFFNYPEGSIRVTGHWRYDKINDIKISLNSIEIKKRLNLPSEKKIIGILTSDLDLLNCVRICLDAIANFSDYIPLIKLHPVIKVGAVRNMIEKLGYPKNTIFEGNLYELLHISDLLICQYSTVLSEAILMDKDVILVNFTKYKLPDEMINREIFMIIEKPEMLSEAINNLIKDDVLKKTIAAKREQYIEEYFFKNDGKSAERVVNEVVGLIEKSNPNHN